MQKWQKNNWDKNLKVFVLMLLVEKVKISEVSDFRFFPIPKIVNSENLESVVLLQILRVVAT